MFIVPLQLLTAYHSAVPCVMLMLHPRLVQVAGQPARCGRHHVGRLPGVQPGPPQGFIHQLCYIGGSPANGAGTRGVQKPFGANASADQAVRPARGEQVLVPGIPWS